MTRQLAFDLPARPALGRGDFFVSPSNAAAVAALDGWRDWPRRVMMIVGPKGSGKTHLAHVWAASAGARIVGPEDLDPAALAAGEAGPMVIEDADAPGPDEERLFHVYNAFVATGHPLLLTATRPPARWPLSLPDLASRMQAIPVVALDPPDDALLQAVLLKLFSDRQLAVTPALVAYLAQRIDRSFAAARDIVERLDRTALAEGRPVNRALAGRLLDNEGPAEA